MKYVSVKIVASKKKHYAKLLYDAYSENELLIEKGTICEVKKIGKNSITLLSIDDEELVIEDESIDHYLEFI